jgi:hypothetical protein
MRERVERSTIRSRIGAAIERSRLRLQLSRAVGRCASCCTAQNAREAGACEREALTGLEILVARDQAGESGRSAFKLHRGERHVSRAFTGCDSGRVAEGFLGESRAESSLGDELLVPPSANGGERRDHCLEVLQGRLGLSAKQLDVPVRQSAARDDVAVVVPAARPTTSSYSAVSRSRSSGAPTSVMRNA